MGSKPTNQSPLTKAVKTVTGYPQFGLIVGLIALLIVMAFITPSFFSFDTIVSQLQNNSIYAILAVGVMMVILTGGIDLSIGATLALSGMTVSVLMNSFTGLPVILWILVSIAIGAVCGAINGILVGKLRIVPLIATLATMYIFRGAAFFVSGGQWFMSHQFPADYQAVTQTKILSIPSLIWITVLIFILAGLFLGYTKPGRRIYAIGTNPESARVAGIKEGNVKILAYTLCGALAGFAGMLFTSNLATCQPQIADGYEMTAIAICILGGVSIVGGKGRIDGVAIGVIMIFVINTFVSLIPGLSIWSDAIQGTIIVAAVILNLVTGKFAEKRELKERSALI